MSRVLYISYDGMTDPLGQSQVLPYLEGLSRMGFTITLMSFEKEKPFELLKSTIQEICDRSHIQWIPLPYLKNPPILSTLLDIRKMMNRAESLHQAEKFDIVHCRSYIAAFAGLHFKKKYGTKFIFDMRGFWPEERVDGGIWDLKNPLYKLIYKYFKKKEREFLLHADEIVSLTHKAKDIILQNKQYSSLRISVIPCCVDTELFVPCEADQRSQIRSQLGIPQESFILLYLGSIGTWYLADEMLEFFQEFETENPGAEFWFISKENPHEIRQKAKIPGIIPDKIKVRSAERTEVVQYLQAADMGIFFIKNSFSKSASSPVKQGEMMACGLPVVCNSGIGDTDFIVTKYESGILVDSLNREAYREVSKKIRNIHFNKEKIVAGSAEYFSLSGGIRLYKELYER